MPNEPTRQAAFRLPESLLNRLDDLAATLTREQPGLKITRADVVRMRLVRGLDTAAVAAKEPR